MYFKEYVVNAYMFVIGLSSWGIDPIIIVKYPYLFAPVLIFVLSSISNFSSDISTITLAFFWYYLYSICLPIFLHTIYLFLRI